MAKTAAKWYEVKSATHATPVSSSNELVRAIQVNSDSVEEVKTLLGELAKSVEETADGKLIINTSHGYFLVNAGDYVVLNYPGHFEVSDIHAFESNYSWLPLKGEVTAVAEPEEEDDEEEEDPDGEA